MSKYVGIFGLTLIGSGILFILFGNIFAGVNGIEGAIYTFGTIIVVLLSFLIALVYYAIDVLKERKG